MRVASSGGRARRLWLAGGALAMDVGIWSMHFTGMLAPKMGMPVTCLACPDEPGPDFGVLVPVAADLFVVHGPIVVAWGGPRRSLCPLLESRGRGRGSRAKLSGKCGRKQQFVRSLSRYVAIGKDHGYNGTSSSPH
ncbi:MAG: diguanylate cyclase/phosphodiesterase (GGDEF & EAL domains) with PAS/PAC sensor(s) [uncultured Rubrobacteraceae bacterium]|uniref:Diguanylate cyclase/phosphodiesterase (GGDEF & EAL domains) with PAS/PAC sensor(S) n=1 Tax=uncultured Rubrobacteraceae bacterium TaxID=349277 RepID=A0A6J4RXI3_9ACTN|nr:MAG: diguanylate cyclase/phosphodiesterase (GGDEF & EAL domains) with PAS/PAC sensor(s) [uncultured Rubrobacteraceae bacterium]